MFHIALTVDRV